MNYPKDVAIDHNENFVLCDSENDRIQVFNQFGAWLQTFGTDGTDRITRCGLLRMPPGILLNPTGLDIDPKNGNIVVCDHHNHCVQVLQRRLLFESYLSQIFDRQGQVVQMIIGVDDPFADQGGIVCFPHTVTIDANGEMIIADTSSLHIFSSNGQFLLRVGRDAGLKCPRKVVINQRGDLLVTDTNEIKIFSSQKG